MVSTRRARNPVRHPHAACAPAPPFRAKKRRCQPGSSATCLGPHLAPPRWNRDIGCIRAATNRRPATRSRCGPVGGHAAEHDPGPTARERAPTRPRGDARGQRCSKTELRPAPPAPPETLRARPARPSWTAARDEAALGAECAARDAERGPGASRFGCVLRGRRDRSGSIANRRARSGSIANRRDRSRSIANRRARSGSIAERSHAPADARVERRSASSVNAAGVSEPHARAEGLRTAGASAGSAASAVCRGGEDDGTRTRNHRRDRPVL